MKIKITIIVGLFSFFGFGQEISTDLPVYSPQSPTTNDLGKYGEVQVNESTGVISPTIPLFEYNAGKISIPITLNYSGNGVKVNQDPTWTGVNWNINPAGVITRVVKDRPDEFTEDIHKAYFSREDLEGLPGARQMSSTAPCTLDPYTEWFVTLQNIHNHVSFDSEVDIFNYNFLGYSGSFFLGANNKVHLIKYDKEIEITFIPYIDNMSEFVIRTPNGDIYTFGGENATESSRTFVNNGSGSNILPYVQNAFYLKKIAPLNGGYVFFEYDNYKPNCVYPLGIQEYAAVSFPVGAHPCNKTVKTIHNDVENLVKLKKITNTFNSQAIIFETSFYGICNKTVKLNRILWKNGNTQIKKIELKYLTINNETEAVERKFFLEKVEFYNKSNQFEYDYELNYKSPELFPSKHSFAQDYFGYYNGKNTNTTLLPITTSALLNNNCNFGLANREADLESSKIGSLEMIKYPTGGQMFFDYELPYKGQEDTIENHFITAYFRDPNRSNTSSYYSNNQDSPPNSFSSAPYYPNGFNSPLILTSPKTIAFNYNIIAKGAYSVHNNVTISVLKPISGGFQLVTSYVQTLKNVEDTVKYYDVDKTFSLPAGQYVFKIAINLNVPIDDPNHSVVANCNLKLPIGTHSVHYPGLRIKKVITTIGEDDLNPYVVRYYYNFLAKLNEESFYFSPMFFYKTMVDGDSSLSGEGTTAVPLLTLTNLSTSNIRNVFHNDLGSHIYDGVTISYGGDNFEKGGKEMSFLNYANRSANIYHYVPCSADYLLDIIEPAFYTDCGDNDSFQSSVLKSERFFNSSLKPIKSTEYNYSSSVDEVANNVRSYKIINRAESLVVDGFILLYKTRSYKYRLLSTKTIEYFGANFTDEVISTTTYQYTDDKVSLPSIIESSNSLGDLKRTNIYYPSDVTALTNLQYGGMSYLNSLTQKHNLSQLVRTENLVNGQLLETKQVSFGNWGTSVLPKTIKTSKGNGENALEDRVEILSYYFGQPSLVQLTDGTKTKYEYNSNLQVILKIENYPSNGSVDPIEISRLEENRPPNEGSCEYVDLYPNSFVTKYDYDPVTKSLIKVTDSKCNVTTYEYDEFNRLKQVKDHQGNVLSENEYHYKP